MVNDAIKSNDKFLNVDQPSLFAINKLKDDLATTHSHMQKWANDESAKQPDWPFKLDAALLLDSVLYNDYSSILKLSESWLENDTGKVKIILIKQQLDLLIADYNDNIRFILSSIESYDMFLWHKHNLKLVQMKVLMNCTMKSAPSSKQRKDCKTATTRNESKFLSANQ